jgi:hypothetical protein
VAYTLGGRVADAVPRCTQVLEQTTATRKPVYEEVLCRLFLGEARVLAGHLEKAYILTEHTFALALQAQKLTARWLSHCWLDVLGEAEEVGRVGLVFR